MIRIAISLFLPLLVNSSFWRPWSGWNGATSSNNRSSTNPVPPSPWATTTTNNHRIADSNGVFWYHGDSTASTTEPVHAQYTGVGTDGVGKITTYIDTEAAAKENGAVLPTAQLYPKMATASDTRPVDLTPEQGQGSLYQASVTSLSGTSGATVETIGRIFGGSNNVVRPAPPPGVPFPTAVVPAPTPIVPAPTPIVPAPTPSGEYGGEGKSGKGKGGSEGGSSECGHGKGNGKGGGAEGYGGGSRNSGSRVFGGTAPTFDDDEGVVPCNDYRGGKSKSKGGKRGRSYSSYEALQSGAPAATSFYFWGFLPLVLCWFH